MAAQSPSPLQGVATVPPPTYEEVEAALRETASTSEGVPTPDDQDPGHALVAEPLVLPESLRASGVRLLEAPPSYEELFRDGRAAQVTPLPRRIPTIPISRDPLSGRMFVRDMSPTPMDGAWV